VDTVLTSKGSVQIARDRYVLNKVINAVECTMCIYVGGLMFTSVDVDVIEEVHKHLSGWFSDTHVY
jgi:(2Fe-2S) ferredoxin